MLRTSLVMSLILIITAVMAGNDIQIKSEIKSVTIFQQGAEIIREAGSDIPKGESRLVFEGITDQIDPRSIQVDARGDFTVISVSWRYDFLQSETREKKITELEAQAITIKRQIRLIEAKKEALQNEKSMLLANRSIGGQDQGVKITELKEAASFFRQRLTEIDSLQLEAEFSIGELKKRIGKLNMQLSELAPTDDGSICEILVDIRSDKPGKGEFLIRYLVNEASWTPVYDFRVINTSQPIALDFKAKVSQNSGEDWTNALVSLSTGNPSVSHLKPEMSPWYLRAGYNQYQPLSPSYGSAPRQNAQTGGFRDIAGVVTDAGTGEPLPFATVIINGFEQTGTITDMNGRFRLPAVPPDASHLTVSFVGYQQSSVPINSNNLNIQMHESGAALESVVISSDLSRSSGLQLLNRISARPHKKAKSISIQTSKPQQLSTMTYAISEPFTIPSNNKEYTLMVEEYTMDAKYRFAAVPRLDCDAFLMAEISGWEEYNLLSGTINLYLEGKYIGQSYLNTDRTGDELVVSLGRDGGIAIDREKLRDFSSRQLIGGTKKTEMTWKITVRNTKDHKVNLKLEDQIPVSKDENVNVSLEEASGASYDTEKGFLNWNFILEPGESREFIVKYTVKYPRKYSVKVY